VRSELPATSTAATCGASRQAPGSVRAASSSSVSSAPSAAAGRPSSRRSASGAIHTLAPT
jgi:hypothetical protein